MGRKQKQETNSATLFRMHLVRNLSFLIFLPFSLCWSSSSSLALFFFCQPCPFHKTTTLCICGLDMEDVFSCSCQFSSCGLTIERSRRRSPALINLTSLFVIWIKNAEKCLHDIDLWSLIFVFSDIEKSGFDFFFFSFTHSFSRRLYWRFAHNRLSVLSKFDWQLKAQRAASERKKWVRCRKRFKREHCSFYEVILKQQIEYVLLNMRWTHCAGRIFSVTALSLLHFICCIIFLPFVPRFQLSSYSTLMFAN